MKAFIGLILSAFVLQALALPAETPKAAEQIPPKPKNAVVDAFREEVDRQFVRYQSFYDRTNAAMRGYRMDHVDLVSSVYMELMTAFGDRIEEVRVATYELNDLIDAKIEEVGSVTQCVADVIDTRNTNSAAVSAEIQACALYANTTLANLLTNTFYPTFALIQAETSTIPISVIDVLSRGNVLEDEDAIIEYLDSRYHVLELRWIYMVSQLLRWETSRFEVEGLFLVDQTSICMADATWQYLLNNSFLEGSIQEC